MIHEQKVETEFSRTRKEMRSKRFIAPIPLDWALRAARLPGKAFRVAVAIHHNHVLTRSNVVYLGNTILEQMGVNKDAKRRALVGLEKEGLILVHRETGKNPRVTIING